MYNEQINQLIDAALIDGILTEKEKQILFKKAEGLGIDLDEFEMILDAKLFEKQKSDNHTTVSPESNKLGDVRKCPACGAITETFATKCSECETEFRNIEASQNIIKFFEKLDDIESNRIDNNFEFNTKSSFGIIDLFKWFMFWPILIPLKIFKFFINISKPVKWTIIDSRKEELILNFPVPASREEILEFLTLAYSRINSNTYFNTLADETKYKNSWNKIWLKKIEQINSKANLAMKNDKQTLDEVNILTENARKILKNNSKKVLHIVLGFISLITILIIWSSISSKIDDNNANQLKEQIIKADKFINSGKYDKAEEIIVSLEDEATRVELKSKLQLQQLTKKTEELEVYLENRDYSKLKFELEKINWIKNSKSYDVESIERSYFKSFLNNKEAINNQLPEEYKIDVGSEFDL
jgi:hypothetical protein